MEPAEISLARTSITVQSDSMTLVKLNCTGSESCAGKLILSVKTTSKTKDKKKISGTITIGTAMFSIAAGKTATVKLKLDAVGRDLLDMDHGRLTARLEILEHEPDVKHTQTATVHLILQKSHGKTKK